MNIIYVVEDFSENGGVERIVSQKANELATHYGHKVAIISVYADTRPMLYRLCPEVELIRLDVPFASKGKGRIATLASRAKTLLTAIRRLNKTAKSLNPDIIFFTTTLGALLLPFCRTNARRVYESHLARKYNPFHSFFWLTERKADATVCLTSGDANCFKHAKDVRIIPNFIEQPKRYAADYGVKRAIAVGRLEEQKGFDILISCWPNITKEHPDWHLDIYGEGSCHNSLQKQIEKLGMQRHITLCGRSNNIMDVYPQYSLHIMPSRYEGQGIALIEAQACGLPSVATDFMYGATDIITNESNGIVAEQGNAKALTNAVCRMMASEELRQKYGTAARAAAHKYFKENVFGMWAELIRTLHK